MTKKPKMPQLNIRLFLAIGLSITAFLVCITAFVVLYDGLRREPLVLQLISGEVSEKKPLIQETNFIAVGDMMFSRNVARHAEKSGSPQWIWEHIHDFLAQADFIFGNLEGPTNGTNKYSYQSTLTFNAVPDLIRTLPNVGFMIVNLANNHILDQGEAGIRATTKILSEIHIQTTGASEDPEKVWEPSIIEKNGIRIAFIGASYAAYNDNGSGQSPLVARMQEDKKLVTAIQKAKEKADIIVITMHAGQEYTRTPTELQKNFAHTAIDAGADIVIGAHPHWVQTVEKYRDKYIFYSLGNFIFDQEFSPETKSGLALQIFVRKTASETSLTHILLKPIIIENYGQPRLANDQEAQKILDTIQQKNILY